MAGVAATPAQAASLTTTRDCYREDAGVRLRGSGFTPGSPISLLLDGRSYGRVIADARGRIRASGRAPSIQTSFRRLSLVAADAGSATRARTFMRVTKHT